MENPRFDHLLHWVPDVDATVARYTAAGLPAHTNPELNGFRNGGWRLDARYVEILTVTDEQALRSSRYADGVAYLRPAIEALPGSGGAVTFAVDVTDARASARRLRAEGREVREFAVDLPDHGVSFVEIFVLDGPAWMPFLITYRPTRDDILASIPPGTFERGPHDLVGVVVETPDPAASARSLADLLGMAVDDDRVALPGAIVRFEPGPRDGIVAMELSGSGGPTEIDGLALRFGC